MKRHTLVVVVALVGVLVFAAYAVSARADQQENSNRCSVKRVKGSYAARISGWQGTGPTRVPISAAGNVVLDGRGGITGSAIFSVDGTILPPAPVNGSYTIDPESCTGETTTTIGTFFFAIGDNSTQTRIVGTTPGTTVTGDAIRQ